MNKILSIIVPTYNMERFLSKCLSSMIVDDPLLLQNLEVIVVIDGATDNSSKIAHSYKAKYPGVFKVIDKENGNYGSCINRGLKEATGKYFKIVDSDDYLDNNIFSRYLERLKNCNADAFLSGYKIVDENGTSRNPFIRDVPKYSVLTWDNIFQSLCKDKHFAMIEVAYKTEILKKCNYLQTEGISYTDQEFIYYPMHYVKSFYVTDLILYNYFIGREGQTMQNDNIGRSFGAHKTILMRMLEYYNSLDREKELPIMYLKSNIIWLLEYMYKICLLTHVSNENEKSLIELDKILLYENKDIYHYLNKSVIRIFKYDYPFIKKWRGKSSLYNRTLILKFWTKLQLLKKYFITN